MWFSDNDYQRLGTLIKWNPAIKTEKDKRGLLKALLEDRIDIITTDHAPHTLEEKQKPYFPVNVGSAKGYFADLVLVDLESSYTVSSKNIFYKCGWSPLEGTTFHSSINKTFVNGNLVYNNGKFSETYKGMNLLAYQ